MSAMRTGILLCLILAETCSAAQPVVPVSDSMGVVAGAVVDAMNHEPLRGDVVVAGTNMGSDTDSAGRFSVRLAPGRYQLSAYAMFHAGSSESATISPACTTLVDFMLLPRKYVDDSIMASLAKIRIMELARLPKEPLINNSIRVAAWKAYLSGKGKYGIKTVVFSVEGDPIFKYLLIEDGTARIVWDGREGKLYPTHVDERHYSHVQLIEDRLWNPDSSRYSIVPFSGTVPRDKELRFGLSNDANDKSPELF
jgi:hypothetical protein